MDGTSDDNSQSFETDDDVGWIRFGYSSVMESWVAWEFQKKLPYSGGYYDQPLSLLVMFSILSLTYNTWKCKNDSKFNWNQFSKTQIDLIRWLENA